MRSPSHRRLQVDGAMAIVLARRVGLLLDILQRTQWSAPSPEDLSSEKPGTIIANKNTNDFHPDWSVEGSEGDPLSGQQKCAPKYDYFHLEEVGMAANAAIHSQSICHSKRTACSNEFSACAALVVALGPLRPRLEPQAWLSCGKREK